MPSKDLVALLFIVAGCGGSEAAPLTIPMKTPASTGPSVLCNPGDFRRCTTNSGCEGTRECLPDSAYGPCVCEESEATGADGEEKSSHAAAGSASPRAPDPQRALAGAPSPPPLDAASSSTTDYRAALYDRPDPQECDEDKDCQSDACCIQIGTTYRKCETGSACTLHWTTLPSPNLPQWQYRQFAGYTGNFNADIVHAHIAELIHSDTALAYRLDNGQYWLTQLASSAPRVASGDECWVVPGKYLYGLYVGDSRTAISVRQIPIVLDTNAVGPFKGMTMQGIYELDGAGYWRVFDASPSTNARTLLASPNNRDYWIFTEGATEDPVFPTTVRSDSTVARAESNGFVLTSGQAWAYYSTPTTTIRPANADHVVVYDQTLVDDNQPDLPLLQTTWIEGRSMGELLLVTPAQ